MNHDFLYRLARERQADLLREAEMNRKARMPETGKLISTRRKLSLVTVLVTAIIIL